MQLRGPQRVRRGACPGHFYFCLHNQGVAAEHFVEFASSFAVRRRTNFGFTDERDHFFPDDPREDHGHIQSNNRS